MSEEQADYIIDAIEMMGNGYGDQKAAIIERPRKVCDIIILSNATGKSRYNNL